MAIVTIPELGRTINEFAEAKEYLTSIGIGYERWDTESRAGEAASAEVILSAYADEIEALKRSGGYVTADVIDVSPDTPNLEEMLRKFNKEHWHDEDEVRFIIEGQGVFHINPKTSPVVAIEVGKGDLLRVPSGTWHWFDLCATRRIRAIRLFEAQSGWTPHYTESDVDKGYIPLCLGPQFVPPALKQA